jgi:hypothetical protein
MLDMLQLPLFTLLEQDLLFRQFNLYLLIKVLPWQLLMPVRGGFVLRHLVWRYVEVWWS